MDLAAAAHRDLKRQRRKKDKKDKKRKKDRKDVGHRPKPSAAPLDRAALLARYGAPAPEGDAPDLPAAGGGVVVRDAEDGWRDAMNARHGSGAEGGNDDDDDDSRSSASGPVVVHGVEITPPEQVAGATVKQGSEDRRAGRSPSPDSDLDIPRRPRKPSSSGSDSDSELAVPRRRRRRRASSGSSSGGGGRSRSSSSSSSSSSTSSSASSRRGDGGGDGKNGGRRAGNRRRLDSDSSASDSAAARVARSKARAASRSTGTGAAAAVASTVYRDADGRRVDVAEGQAASQARAAADEAAASALAYEWGKGAADKAREQDAVAALQAAQQRGLAVYADDAALNRAQQSRLRAADPMLQFVQSARGSTYGHEADQPGAPAGRKPRYKGPAAPPNRFGLAPGYRWDGIDRSNGFERRLLQASASEASRAEARYRRSAADM